MPRAAHVPAGSSLSCPAVLRPIGGLTVSPSIFGRHGEVQSESHPAVSLVCPLGVRKWHQREDCLSWRIVQLAGVKLTLPKNCRISAVVESPGGISPPGAPRAVHDPLEARLPMFGRCLNGFASPTGSSRFRLASGQGRTTQPLRSSPITEPSTLLRAAPPLRLASVLSPSRLEPLAACPFTSSA